MGTVSRGFRGRRERPSAELPPGQYLVEDFPVLSAGPTPSVDLADWELVITSETDEQRRWDWTAFRALPSEQVTVDLHCVTHWSKLGTTWEGVPLDTLLDGVVTSAGFALVTSYGGYTTNLPLEDLTDGKAWVAFGYDGQDLEPEHGGPAAGAPPVPVEERQVGPLDPAAGPGRAGLLGEPRLPQLRRPLAGAAVLGRLRTEAAMTSPNRWSDGDALAGHVGDVFRVDLTSAVGRCSGCGPTAPMAEARVFDHAPGVVARCPVCDQVLLRLVRGPGRTWLDVRGLAYLQLPAPEGT